MLEDRASPAKSGVYGFLKTPVATTTLSASKPPAAVWMPYFPSSCVSASTEAPLRTGKPEPLLRTQPR